MAAPFGFELPDLYIPEVTMPAIRASLPCRDLSSIKIAYGKHRSVCKISQFGDHEVLMISLNLPAPQMQEAF